MNLTNSDRETELVERILQLTESPQSEPYYRKAIGLIGIGLVEEELGELRYRLQTGSIDSPARYFTHLLQKHIAALPTAQLTEPSLKRSEDNTEVSQNTHFSPSPLELFSELKPRHKQDNDTGFEESAMDTPFSTKTIPWVTFIGPEFFTLSTNKMKSDTVSARFRMLDGQMIQIPLIRGKFFPKDEERGILTAEEGRILGAMESVWVEQGCRYARFNNGSLCCFAKVPVKEIARLLGWGSFGGNDLNHLKRKAINLKTKGYYLELEALQEFRIADVKGYGFSLVDAVEPLDKVRYKTEQTTLMVRFSDPYSRQLIARRVVSRPKELLTIRSELAFLVRLYLEPVLMKKSNGYKHSIELINLINVLNLPRAGWHAYKSRRKNIFERSINEINGMKTTDGRVISVKIEQGKNEKDFLLSAELFKADNEILANSFQNQ